MPKILQLNEISNKVNEVLGGGYTMSKACTDPDAIILRSFSMHEYNLPHSVQCVARAGAGVNNIPVEKYTKDGVVVFNTPGANANAVKELVIASLLLASRKIIPSIEWAASLKGKGADVPKLVEKGKAEFTGPEIINKTIGVVGLGAIGALVANACVELGMSVVGYDPYISIDAAWNLSNHIKKETDINHLFSICDYITIHVPYMPATKNLINADSIAKMKDGVAVINCSRAELVNSADIIEGVKSGKVARYVTDFPTDEVLGVENIIAIPHLGASTPEAEDNCAVMAARQLADFLENGNLTNSVNFGNCSLPRSGKCRLTIFHKNIQTMLTKMTECVSNHKINISNMVSQSTGDYAYTILELDDVPPAGIEQSITSINGIIKVRIIK